MYHNYELIKIRRMRKRTMLQQIIILIELFTVRSLINTTMTISRIIKQNKNCPLKLSTKLQCHKKRYKIQGNQLNRLN